uniref:Uncharacterized protein n=1 Tax=Anguilla anguilla TaxID=7936 RepID=A0A0E9QMH0_ANGAN
MYQTHAFSTNRFPQRYYASFMCSLCCLQSHLISRPCSPNTLHITTGTNGCNCIKTRT